MRRLFAPREALRAAACLLALAITAPAYVGQWHSFTNKDRITSLIEHDGFLYAGTQGGIRRTNPETLQRIVFDNTDGLLDVWITGLARDSAGTLWAVSRNGYVQSLAPDGRRWNAWLRDEAS
jgi:ligand-binding sensor domain-containing protein